VNRTDKTCIDDNIVAAASISDTRLELADQNAVHDRSLAPYVDRVLEALRTGTAKYASSTRKAMTTSTRVPSLNPSTSRHVSSTGALEGTGRWIASEDL
jgi:hypothetical protein